MKKQLNLILLGIFLMPSVAFCKTNNFVELGEFIKLFIISKSETPDWDIGAGNTRRCIKRTIDDRVIPMDC